MMQGEKPPYRGIEHTCPLGDDTGLCLACQTRSEDAADRPRLEAEVRDALADRSLSFAERLARVRAIEGEGA